MTKIAEQVDANNVSRISAGTTIVGDVYAESDIRVDGSIKGTLCSRGKVVIGEQAVIEGIVACYAADLLGRIDGDIHVRDTLSIKSSAALNGNFYPHRFEVQMGASITGAFKTISEEEFDKTFDGLASKVIK